MPSIQAQIDGIGTLEFPEGTDPEVIHQTVRRLVMNHQATQSAVPQGLQGGPDPEYKPFFSGGNLRDIASGVGKVGAQDAAFAGKQLSKVPVIGAPFDPQKIKDMEDYSTSANKGELFGKVIGNIGQALPLLYGGGEFAGGVADEVGPALVAPLARAAAPVLGRVAGQLGKRALQGAGAGAAMYGLEKLKELF
jgi:hypothetical protein